MLHRVGRPCYESQKAKKMFFAKRTQCFEIRKRRFGKKQTQFRWVFRAVLGRMNPILRLQSAFSVQMKPIAAISFRVGGAPEFWTRAARPYERDGIRYVSGPTTWKECPTKFYVLDVVKSGKVPPVRLFFRSSAGRHPTTFPNRRPDKYTTTAPGRRV